MNHAQNVRDAAQALHKAIAEAMASGHAVQWPRRADDLPGIAVSLVEPPAATVPVEPKKARKKPAKSAPDAA